MYIDADLIKNGISTKLIQQLILRHSNDCERIKRLKAYYKGEHNILKRQKDSDGAANNRVVINWAKYITTVSTSYLLGNPVTYEVLDKYDISNILNRYRQQHISTIDMKLDKAASICGVGIEMVYSDEDANPVSFAVPSENAFVVYDDTAAHRKLFGVYSYERYDISGTVSGVMVMVADKNNLYTYSGHDLSRLELTETQEHYFGDVPFIEYLNNDERQGDFEQQISQIDAYNTLMSDRVNDKEQFVDAFLLLLGIDINDKQAKKLLQEKILMGDTDADARYLNKVLNETDTEVLRKAIKDDIYATSMVPNLSDENFGNNVSGVAIKYKLLVFEQLIQTKERLFEEGLRERLKLYMNFFAVKANQQLVPIYEIDVRFKRNLPANELELSQIVNNLTGSVSNETLLGLLPFISDAKEEAKLVNEENLNHDKQTILTQRELMRFGDDNAEQ